MTPSQPFKPKHLDDPQTPLQPKRRCTVTVTETGWQGSRTAALAAGCSSVSEMMEKLGRGELSLVQSDQIDPYFQEDASPTYPEYHPPSFKDELFDQLIKPIRRFSTLAITGACAALILIPILYVMDLALYNPDRELEATKIPETGDRIGDYTVTDHFRIRPVHPVTGAQNVPHNGVDLDTPVGTPVYAVGRAGDQVNVTCWWDADGGGWVANQTAQSFPDYVFQSLHLLKDECRTGTFEAGDIIALTGNSGLGTGAHYDFRVKIKGQYVPPDQQYLESAIIGMPLPSPQKRFF